MVDFKTVVECNKYIQDKGITAFDLLSYEVLLKLYDWADHAVFTPFNHELTQKIGEALDRKKKHIAEEMNKHLNKNLINT